MTNDIEPLLKARNKLLGDLPITGRLLRGSLLERTVRRAKPSPSGRGNEGRRVYVLTVSYPGGRTRQLSIRRERVAEVRQWLDNYQKLKQAIESICELNHELLRPAPHQRRAVRRSDSTERRWPAAPRSP